MLHLSVRSCDNVINTEAQASGIKRQTRTGSNNVHRQYIWETLNLSPGNKVHVELMGLSICMT